ncbi:hypothetical protein BDZ89DRAFT_672841 [Hymenopellis radicata]|nr:hypothetical protein BDZ89DRAFT_672841 [Hymenopellis radicata]
MLPKPSNWPIVLRVHGLCRHLHRQFSQHVDSEDCSVNVPISFIATEFPIGPRSSDPQAVGTLALPSLVRPKSLWQISSPDSSDWMWGFLFLTLRVVLPSRRCVTRAKQGRVNAWMIFRCYAPSYASSIKQVEKRVFLLLKKSLDQLHHCS